MSPSAASLECGRGRNHPELHEELRDARVEGRLHRRASQHHEPAPEAAGVDGPVLQLRRAEGSSCGCTGRRPGEGTFPSPSKNEEISSFQGSARSRASGLGGLREVLSSSLTYPLSGIDSVEFSRYAMTRYGIPFDSGRFLGSDAHARIPIGCEAGVLPELISRTRQCTENILQENMQRAPANRHRVRFEARPTSSPM